MIYVVPLAAFTDLKICKCLWGILILACPGLLLYQKSYLGFNTAKWFPSPCTNIFDSKFSDIMYNIQFNSFWEWSTNPSEGWNMLLNFEDHDKSSLPLPFSLQYVCYTMEQNNFVLFVFRPLLCYSFLIFLLNLTFMLKNFTTYLINGLRLNIWTLKN